MASNGRSAAAAEIKRNMYFWFHDGAFGSVGCNLWRAGYTSKLTNISETVHHCRVYEESQTVYISALYCCCVLLTVLGSPSGWLLGYMCGRRCLWFCPWPWGRVFAQNFDLDRVEQHWPCRALAETQKKTSCLLILLYFITDLAVTLWEKCCSCPWSLVLAELVLACS